MADANERPTRSRGNTSGAASRRSGTNSRGTSPANLGLDRVETGTHPDYHPPLNHHDSYTQAVFDDESSEDTDLTEKETEDSADLQEETTEDIVPEVRDGIEDQRDIEAGPKLERKRTSRSVRSVRDPNLVSWSGPDDPDNPKNWTFKRKWAATLVGTYMLHRGLEILTKLLPSIFIHFYFSGILFYDRPRGQCNFKAVQYHKSGRARVDIVHIRSGVRNWTSIPRTII